MYNKNNIILHSSQSIMLTNCKRNIIILSFFNACGAKVWKFSLTVSLYEY